MSIAAENMGDEMDVSPAQPEITLMSLPFELLTYIMGFVPTKQLMPRKRVSSAFRDLIVAVLSTRKFLSVNGSKSGGAPFVTSKYERRFMLDHDMYGFGSHTPSDIAFKLFWNNCITNSLTSLTCVNINLLFIESLVRFNSKTLVTLVLHDPLPTGIDPDAGIKEIDMENLISYPKLRNLICSGFDNFAVAACPVLQTLVIRSNISVNLPAVAIPSLETFAVIHGFESMPVSEFIHMNAGNLVEIDIGDTFFPFDERMPVVFKHLQRLKCKNISVPAFNSCPELRHLKLTSMQVCHSLPNIKWPCSKLQTFQISDQEWEENVMQLAHLCGIIEGMRNLRKLSISCRLALISKRDRIFDLLFPALHLLEDLQLLITTSDGSKINFDSEMDQILTGCPNLKRISCTGILVTDALLSSLSLMHQLSLIHIQ